MWRAPANLDKGAHLAQDGPNPHLQNLEAEMDKKLHLLDSFTARGADGKPYKVMAYEHLIRLAAPVDEPDAAWESTGKFEYRLADGTRVEADAEGKLRIVGSGLVLQAEAKL
jgi:hypothetical protein